MLRVQEDDDYVMPKRQPSVHSTPFSGSCIFSILCSTMLSEPLGKVTWMAEHSMMPYT